MGWNFFCGILFVSQLSSGKCVRVKSHIFCEPILGVRRILLSFIEVSVRISQNWLNYRSFFVSAFELGEIFTVFFVQESCEAQEISPFLRERERERERELSNNIRSTRKGRDIFFIKTQKGRRVIEVYVSQKIDGIIEPFFRSIRV